MLFATPSLARLTPSTAAESSCGEQPPKELSEVFAYYLVKEEAARKNEYIRDDPTDVAPKHWRLVEERAKGREISQQSDGIENAKQAEVNQR
jgi:hypothetical protein